MSAPAQARQQHGEAVVSGGRRGRGRWALGTVVVVLIAAGIVIAVSGVFGGGAGTTTAGGSGAATSLATVTRQSLSEQTQVTGVLGYAGSYTVLGQAHGTVTSLPVPGQVIDDGQVLYRVNQSPVVLLYGTVPAYRALASGNTGSDVTQLNHDLVALGYAHAADVDAAWSHFTSATNTAVKKLQKHLGVSQTGKLSLGAVVFLPTAARVTTISANLGGPDAGPVMAATSTTPTITVALSADRQSEVKAGDQVMITLPDGGTTPGTVASVGTVATISADNSGGPGGSTPTVPVTIRPADPSATGGLDQTPVLVAVNDQTVSDVLAVPVTALVATAGGGYAIEVVSGDGAHRLVTVTPGLFDDAAGLVQVSGTGLAAGQRVVVPGQ